MKTQYTAALTAHHAKHTTKRKLEDDLKAA